jgi:hypothetical protein
MIPQLGVFVATLHAKTYDILKSGSHAAFKCRKLILSPFWGVSVLQYLTAPTCNDLLTHLCQNQINFRPISAPNCLIMYLMTSTGLIKHE